MNSHTSLNSHDLRMKRIDTQVHQWRNRPPWQQGEVWLLVTTKREDNSYFVAPVEYAALIIDLFAESMDDFRRSPFHTL